MKTKAIGILCIISLLFSFVMTGCGTKDVTEKSNGESLNVGMVTDSGTIDDKSFNQGTWEGITRYENEKGNIEKKYLQPQGEQHADYVNSITNLVDAGYKIIITPGFKFETAVNEAADKFKDTSFVLIDGEPKKDDKVVKHDNVVSVFFNEHEAGFLAGIAAALSTKTGQVGFIGGMEIPPVQKFGWGYKAGVEYAKAKLDVNVSLKDANFIYQGTFNETAAGQQLASGMYNKGVDIIFHAAGGVGVGVIKEAKERALKGKEVYVIGVDSDQYADGIYDKANKISVILTSALKRVDVAAFNNIDAKLNDKFPGGQTITLSIKDNGVGLPEENPNLSEKVIKKIDEVKKEVIDEKIIVPSTKEDLEKFIKGDYSLSK